VFPTLLRTPRGNNVQCNKHKHCNLRASYDKTSSSDRLKIFKLCRPAYFAVFVPGTNLASKYGSYLDLKNSVDLCCFGTGALGLG